MNSQQKILSAIHAHWKARGYSPSFRDIERITGFSTNTILYHLKKLVGRGLVSYTPGVARTIMLRGMKVVLPELSGLIQAAEA